MTGREAPFPLQDASVGLEEDATAGGGSGDR